MQGRQPVPILLRPFESTSTIDRMSRVTEILASFEQRDPKAAEKLLPLVYDELRKLAAQKLTRENPGHTLQATALVHEAYLRLVDTTRDQQWNSRGHFFAAAAEAMRRILVDQARHKASLRAGGGRQQIELSQAEFEVKESAFDILQLDEALQQLAQRDSRSAEVVKLRFFAGMTIAEVAEIQGVSTATVENDWAYAKSWLRLQLSSSGDGGG
jgi:RNA polymerase sigma factor (TIGR02999 family)